MQDSFTTQSVIIVCLIYVVFLLGISLYSRTKISNVEDYLVAGRSLGFPMASATLIATWFGAGTLLTVSDEVKLSGLSAALMDPVGSAICLVLAGIFFAKPLWNAKLYTLSDLYRRRFGKRVELLSAIVMVPSYFGWIAVQYFALAQFLSIFTGLDVSYGIVLVAVVGTAYTYVGGMWSVALTDMMQIMMLLMGLVIISLSILGILGDGELFAGITRLADSTPEDKLKIFPRGNAQEFMDSLALLAIGSLGNIPGQDLCQRLFASRSANVAKWSCLFSAISYAALGTMPVMMGLASRLLLHTDVEVAVISQMLKTYMSAPFILIFVVVILSVVLSTIDSATLSPSSVLAQNFVLSIWDKGLNPLLVNKIAVLVVAGCSLGVAFLGENAYSLLESAYEIQFVGLFVPLLVAVFWKNTDGDAMFESMLVGVLLWGIHFVLGWGYFLEPWFLPKLPIPIALFSPLIFFLFYIVRARPTKDV